MAVTFIESPQFPTNISYGSKGGPQYQTAIVETKVGAERRNINWSLPRHSYDVAYGIKTQSDLETVLEYFHVVAGMGYGFRFKDWADYKSCSFNATPATDDQTIANPTTDGDTTYQLIKTYSWGGSTRARNIYKPISGTIVAELDGSPLTYTTDFTVDSTTGILTLTANPGDSAVLKAGFEFDVPVRFATDEIKLTLEAFQAGELNVPLIELKYDEWSS